MQRDETLNPGTASPPDGPSERTARSISREDLANLPIRRYEGSICPVESAQDLERARADLLNERVVGFDTETRPAFRVGERYDPCLFQAATANGVYIFRLGRPDVHALLAELLSAAQVVKAGISVADDLKALQRVFPFEEKNVLDLGRIARQHGYAQTGVRNLAGLLLGWRIPKGAKTTNWAAPRLTAHQIAYAAMDAWVCRELYLRFAELGLLPARPAGQ